VIAAFALRGLPAQFPPSRLGGVLAAGVLAGLVGLAAAAGTLALTGKRDPSAVGGFFLSAAEPRTGGRNVVNTILVDFRGLDTLGEVSVLAAAALGLTMLVGRTRPGESSVAPYQAVLGPARRVLVPIIVAMSGYLLVRGHDEPGGGFIAALVAGTAVALGALAGEGPVRLGRWLRPVPLIAAGLLLCLSVGLGVMTLGYAFLAPVKGPFGLSSSLLFDAGVFLIVLGVMLTAVDHFGVDEGGPR
jgi:multicomponent Na+:H+ antiporter subunit A